MFYRYLSEESVESAVPDENGWFGFRNKISPKVASEVNEMKKAVKAKRRQMEIETKDLIEATVASRSELEDASSVYEGELEELARLEQENAELTQAFKQQVEKVGVEKSLSEITASCDELERLRLRALDEISSMKAAESTLQREQARLVQDIASHEDSILRSKGGSSLAHPYLQPSLQQHWDRREATTSR